MDEERSLHLTNKGKRKEGGGGGEKERRGGGGGEEGDGVDDGERWSICNLLMFSSKFHSFSITLIKFKTDYNQKEGKKKEKITREGIVYQSPSFHKIVGFSCGYGASTSFYSLARR